ncbi:MAG: tetratricopeptide repeat protein [Thermoanaerobaculia bacterium]
MRRLIAIVTFFVFAGLASAQQSPLDGARKLMQEKKHKEARAALETLVAKEPANGQALLELVRCTRELGDLEASIAAARTALAIPFQPRVSRLELATSLALKGERDAAIGEIEQLAAMGANKGIADRVRSAPAFAAYKGDARFEAVVARLVPCGTPEYRQFDFWVGNWEVRDPAGNVVGRNDVTLELDGCMIMEHWHSSGGHAGMSFNFFEPTDGTWNQIFLDNGGVPSGWPPLKGKLVDGKMVLSSPAGASPQTRWIWSKTDDGRVRQMAEQLGADGKSWTVIWDSYYSKMKYRLLWRRHSCLRVAEGDPSSRHIPMCR